MNGEGLDRPAVVLTRAPADNRSLAEALRASGYRPLEVPLTEVVPPADDGAALRLAAQRLASYDLVTFSSANGVRALAEVLGDRPWPPKVRVAVVGPVTARSAAALGWPVDVVPDRATAASLVAAIEPTRAGRHVLAPLAAAAADTIETGLTAKGYAVDRVEAYQTVTPTSMPDSAAELADANASAVAFFAPSAVDRWCDLIDHPTPPVVIAIGPSTVARATQRGLDGVRMADPHTEAGVLAALHAALRRTR